MIFNFDPIDLLDEPFQGLAILLRKLGFKEELNPIVHDENGNEVYLFGDVIKQDS